MTNSASPRFLNPYDVLAVSSGASKAEITKAVAVAMKRKQYPVDVIAKAQKSLMKAEERIIADYLRPILPTIKRFKETDLSELEKPEPRLVLLPEFDGLDVAIAQAEQDERQEQEPLPTPEPIPVQSHLITQPTLKPQAKSLSLPELLQAGIQACKENRSPKAVKYLEDYCDACPDRNTHDYVQAQMWLVKAYQFDQQVHRAIALCQQMSTHPNPKVQEWTKKTLPLLTRDNSRV